MRVLSILPFSPPSKEYGGAERQMHSLHRGLVQRGIDVDVLADIRQVGADFQVFEGVRVWGVPFPELTSHPWRPGNLKLWIDWRSIRRTTLALAPKPDLIQATTFRQPALIGHALSRVLGIPWVVRTAASGRDGDFAFASNNWLTRFALPQVLASVSKIVTLDPLTRDEAVKFGAEAAKVCIIRNGLALARLPTLRTVAATRPGRRVLYLGRLIPEKGVDTLVRACAALFRDAPAAPFELWIAGDGPDMGNLRRLASQLGIQDRCRFLGAVAVPEDVFEQADIFVNPSHSEGLPNAVLEAAACGVPVVLSDIPVQRDIAQNAGMANFVFPVGDGTALADRIRRFFALDVNAQNRLRVGCAEYGRQFRPALRDQAYVDLYMEILRKQ